ncbi:MBL fold metallo-hydrolase [Brasilonema octagenarum UFV-E1]|uniref:MBL fold metallo-hydrolase n=1 Tax=Brasilonema sennae CENA114 TaxID=415709 RepID=A0A856M6Q2_9CYAN|nr:MBL fold metallo-hydrolase [Brasilonema sennae]QDL06825.1 MBL fold metallo-hydrolase [Brasilonema sennae CENA114]QDL13191.1 MBL fold metallo-hydrolase [Brasilonema octagenarum UFV-E1]
MAHLNLRRPQNVSGDFYVDTSCIDCDTCRWMVPDVFTEVDEQSVVYHQPLNEVQRLAALQALLACPTSSIGTVEKPQDVKVAQLSFPIPVEDNVYHCGYHSENSYGAASYFIERPEGNILVDSPRFTPPLVKRLEQMGGVRYMYLTHRDDVADHQKFAEHFQCQRILHEDDITSGTRNVEIPLSGTEPFEFAPDILILAVPGHTKGHTVLLYKNKFLFSGDHLAWSDSLKQLIAFRDYCWYSWPEQIKSMGELVHYTFEWVLPGHGRRYHADVETMKKQMDKCVEWIESVGR